MITYYVVAAEVSPSTRAGRSLERQEAANVAIILAKRSGAS